MKVLTIYFIHSVFYTFIIKYAGSGRILTFNTTFVVLRDIHFTTDPMAEDRGFEPLGLLHPQTFQVCTINHSDNSPGLRVWNWTTLPFRRIELQTNPNGSGSHQGFSQRKRLDLNQRRVLPLKVLAGLRIKPDSATLPYVFPEGNWNGEIWTHDFCVISTALYHWVTFHQSKRR